MSQFRVLLGAAVHSIHEVVLPTYASYKLDGIRAFWNQREFFSRSLKTIPNRAVREVCEMIQKEADISCTGWDGELICGEPNASDVFRQTESRVMRRTASAEGVRWHVFDCFSSPGGFEQRLQYLRDLPPFIYKLPQTLISSYSDLQTFEAKAIDLGFEGVICRAPQGRYKTGRSTVREQFLIKLKRFTDDEATVIGFEELQHNANPVELDERGYAHRSSHQSGKINSGMLGALVVDWRGYTLRIGTGFNMRDRQEIWNKQADYHGKAVTFKYLNVGIKELPRHPVFLRFRPEGT